MRSSDWQPGPRVEGAGGLGIATWDLGGEGPPLLLLHATGFHAAMWLPVAPALRASFRLWAVDLRGHGASDHHPAGEYRDWSLFTDDVLAVVDALGLGDAPGGLRAAGHSLGGAVLLLAEQRRPGLLRAAWCFEPIVLSPEDRVEMRAHDTPLAIVASKRRATFASREAARANYASKPPFAAFRPDALDAYVDHAFIDQTDGTVALACRPAEEATVYEGASRHDAWEHLGTPMAPVTLAGSDPAVAPASRIPAMAERLPHARIDWYPALTHFAPMEDPDRMGRDMLATLA
jgi:pimeloyl-ACP methyl ester carboxylesterase